VTIRRRTRTRRFSRRRHSP